MELVKEIVLPLRQSLHFLQEYDIASNSIGMSSGMGEGKEDKKSPLLF